MARPLRIEFAGALYHITSRGDRQEDIYLDDGDRALFMLVLGEVCELFNWSVHAWCQMTNHYHLLVETPDANLSKGMRYLNGVYTQRFNRKNACVGHVFQGRYKAILVDGDAYLLELSRYIVLNPVRAGMVESAEDWNWSNYKITTGIHSCPTWFDREWVLAAFGKQEELAIKNYLQFVVDGVGRQSPWGELKNQIYLGSDQFIDKIQTKLSNKNLPEVPRLQQRPMPKALEEYEIIAIDRNDAICLAYRSGGYTLTQIGEYYSLHYSSVSRIIHKEMQK